MVSENVWDHRVDRPLNAADWAHLQVPGEIGARTLPAAIHERMQEAAIAEITRRR
jgi:hypothetical protein